MKKMMIKQTILSVALVIAFSLTGTLGKAYTIDKTYQLGANEGSSQIAQNKYIIIHDTSNPRATGQNEATYMKRNWQSAYTQYIVGDGKVYQVGTPGYVSWGALNANPYAPVQIELQATPNKELFKKNYAVYVDLIRDSAKQFGIPLILDGTGNGIKSHLWVTQNLGGDHTDPYGYLASMGISKEQLAKDIANGLDSKNEVKPDKQATKYKVASSDNLIKIGKKYKMNWKTIANTNALKAPYLLSVGQTLVIDTNAQTTNTDKPVTPVVPTNGWVKESGTFYPNSTINIRSGAGTNYSVIGHYFLGESVTYDSYKVSGGYVWIHYKSYGNRDCYMAVRPQGGTAWGTFK